MKTALQIGFRIEVLNVMMRVINGLPRFSFWFTLHPVICNINTDYCGISIDLVSLSVKQWFD